MTHMSHNNDVLYSMFHKNTKSDYSNFDYDLPLTTGKVGKTQKELLGAIWIIYTRARKPSENNAFDHGLFSSLKKIMDNDDYVMVFICIDQWCTDLTVEDYMIEFLESMH